MKNIILEKATLNIIKGKEKEFEKNFLKAEKFIKKAKGYISHELHKSAKYKNIYLLLVKWQTIKIIKKVLEIQQIIKNGKNYYIISIALFQK